MKIKNRMNKVKTFAKLSCAAVSLFALQTMAAEVRYNLNWEGQEGYTASGYFTYDDETAGQTVIGEELTDFYLQPFDPQGNALGEFTFEDTANNIFFFTFDTVGERVLLTNEVDPNGEHELSRSHVFWGFATRKTTNGSVLSMSSRRGCGSTFPGEGAPEIDLFLERRACSGSTLDEWLDTGPVGTGITATLVPPSQSSELHAVSIQVDEGQGPVPATGGRFNYDATIENLDTAENSFIQWSVLTLPTGEDYGIHRTTNYTLSANSERVFTRTRITIPDWFPAGEYSFTWYVADTDNAEKIIVRDSFSFEKLAP